MLEHVEGHPRNKTVMLGFVIKSVRNVDLTQDINTYIL